MSNSMVKTAEDVLLRQRTLFWVVLEDCHEDCEKSLADYKATIQQMDNQDCDRVILDLALKLRNDATKSANNVRDVAAILSQVGVITKREEDAIKNFTFEWVNGRPGVELFDPNAVKTKKTFGTLRRKLTGLPASPEELAEEDEES